MTLVQPPVRDLSRSVARLDEFAAGHPELTIDEMRASVARNITYQVDRAGMSSSRRPMTPIEVRAILLSHGASPFTIAEHAQAITQIVRNAEVTA